MEFTKIGTQALLALGIGGVLAIVLPLALALIWKVRKKEPFPTILVGAIAFLLFVIVLEKPIQNALLFPAQMGRAEHPFSSFVSARPWLLAFLAGLFPGVFEETGRLIAFKTVLKKRRNRETGISYGIGHGGFEVMYILGVTYFTYLAYALMINSGSFGTLVEQAAAAAPAQADALKALPDQLAGIGFADIGMALLERVFAVLFHIGASILVFFAGRDRKRFWLYPLAIVLHTAMDVVAALYSLGIGSLSTWTVEAVLAGFGVLTFLGAYFLLYRKDKPDENP